jgi:hypothetical protein
MNLMMDGQTKHWEQSLLKLIELEPGVVFNIMKDHEQGAVWDGSPNCHCLEIATYIERLCCNMHPDKCISLWLVRCIPLQYIRMLLPEWRSYLPPVLEANLSSLNCCNIALIQCSNIQTFFVINLHPFLTPYLVMDLHPNCISVHVTITTNTPLLYHEYSKTLIIDYS